VDPAEHQNDDEAGEGGARDPEEHVDRERGSREADERRQREGADEPVRPDAEDGVAALQPGAGEPVHPPQVGADVPGGQPEELRLGVRAQVPATAEAASVRARHRRGHKRYLPITQGSSPASSGHGLTAGNRGSVTTGTTMLTSTPRTSTVRERSRARRRSVIAVNGVVRDHRFSQLSPAGGTRSTPSRGR
jgi:hypothetical protein